MPTPTGQTIDKGALIDQVIGATQLDRKTITTVINATLDAIQANLASGNKVRLTGFGTFQRTERAERPGVNPHTKEPMTISAQSSARWTPGDSLKAAIAGGGAPGGSTTTTSSTGGRGRGRQKNS